MKGWAVLMWSTFDDSWELAGTSNWEADKETNSPPPETPAEIHAFIEHWGLGQDLLPSEIVVLEFDIPAKLRKYTMDFDEALDQAIIRESKVAREPSSRNESLVEREPN